MLGEEKRKKAKQIAESLKLADLPYFMARVKIENDGSIFGNEKEEMLNLVKKIMS